MATGAIESSRVSPLMAAALKEKEQEQPKIALPDWPQQQQSTQITLDTDARGQAIRELSLAKAKVEERDPAGARVHIDGARSAIDAISLASGSHLGAERLADDARKQVHNLLDDAQSWGEEAQRMMTEAKNYRPTGSDPLLNVHASSMRMAKAVGEIMNHHAWRLDRNTESVQKLTELRSLLEQYRGRESVDFTKPETPVEEQHFARICELLPTARENRVLWGEENGWNDERQRDARIQGVDFATQSLSKTGEQLTLRLQHSQNTYNQHLMNAAYALHRQAKIIELVLQLLARS